MNGCLTNGDGNRSSQGLLSRKIDRLHLANNSTACIVH